MSECVHHWLLATPHPGCGQYVSGTCRRCGATRNDFPAFEPEVDFKKQAAVDAQARARAMRASAVAS